MSIRDLSAQLERLHQELALHPQLDAKSIESLRLIAQDIQEVLARSDAQTPSTNANLADRVRDLVADFEQRHPQLTNTLSTIAERLSDMGI
jgi:hypothetical protein